MVSKGLNEKSMASNLHDKKKFKKNLCPSFTSPLQKRTLGFSIYLNSRKKIGCKHMFEKCDSNINFPKIIKIYNFP